ncbi:MAG TPA: hypothetical protein VJ476_02870 [Rhizomicrobium sp.]|nr:hypothetical protein [Rhizomicrobium sp.]
MIRDVVLELYSMFAGDSRMSLSALAVVGVSAVVALGVSPMAGGAFLLVGSLVVLVTSILTAARGKN